MIEARHLTKRYGHTVAVDEASFVVRPGRVTGFLGPNGAGKSTTMRMILGLDAPSSGSVLIDGQLYRELTDPLRSVGALLDAKAIIGGRSAASHLTWLADSNGITRRRVSEVLDIAGLSDVAGQRVGTFRSACTSGSASPRPCSATPRRCCSTSRSTAWTPTASCGSGT
jgi:ABC-2 type transport system ATP-binding protein